MIGMQLEIEVDNLAQLEAFWGQIPPQAHKAWSQRAQVLAYLTHATACSDPTEKVEMTRESRFPVCFCTCCMWHLNCHAELATFV